MRTSPKSPEPDSVEAVFRDYERGQITQDQAVKRIEAIRNGNGSRLQWFLQKLAGQ